MPYIIGKPRGPVTVSISSEGNKAFLKVHNEGLPIPEKTRIRASIYSSGISGGSLRFSLIRSQVNNPEITNTEFGIILGL